MSATELRPADRAAASSASRPVTFLPYLEGLRGLAALYVVLYHADKELTRNRPNYATGLPFHATFLHYGHFSVAVFIVISGYVLSLPLLRGDGLKGGPLRFLGRRARRLLPAYYVALLLSIPVDLYNNHFEGIAFAARTLAAQIATHVFLVHDFSSNWRIIYGLNGALWTIAVEFQIYVVFVFLLVPIRGRFGMLPMVVVAFTLGLFPALWGNAHHHALTFRLGAACFWFLGLFALGFAAALSTRNVTRVVRRLWGLLAATLAVTTVGVIAVFGPAAQSDLTLLCAIDILLGCTTAATFTYIAQAEASGRRSPVAQFLGARPCVALGVFSYSLYLTHLPLLRVVTHLLARTRLPDGSVAALVYVGVIPALVAFAYIFSLAFEQPFLSAYRRHADDALSVTAPPA